MILALLPFAIACSVLLVVAAARYAQRRHMRDDELIAEMNGES